MPRQSRIDAPGALHHVICRGMERHPIFEDDVDREDFVKRLGEILSETGTPCYGIMCSWKAVIAIGEGFGVDA